MPAGRLPPARPLPDAARVGWRDAWLDLLHGGRCVGCGTPGRPLCRSCLLTLPVSGTAVRPTPCPTGLAACFAAGEYDGLLRALVIAHKEHAVFSLAAPLGRVLAAAARLAVAGADTVPPVRTVLVPVPSRPAVVRGRGHDPVLRMTRAGARHLRALGHRVEVSTLLAQRGAVLDQAGLGAGARAANLHGSLRVRASARAVLARRGEPVAVVVCDDVLTTGATAREAQRALEDSGLVVRAVATVAATRKRGKPRAWALPLSGLSD